jgi:periplasmic protein TonB
MIGMAAPAPTMQYPRHDDDGIRYGDTGKRSDRGGNPGLRRAVLILFITLMHAALFYLLLSAQRSGFAGRANSGSDTGSAITVSLLDSGTPADGKSSQTPPQETQPHVTARSQSAVPASIAPGAITIPSGEELTLGDQPAGGRSGAETGTPSSVSSAFQKRLLDHISAYRQYPSAARRDRQHGVTTLLFTMDRNGIVLGIWVQKTAGFPALDQAAIATVLRAQPLPAIPAELPEPLNITLPVSFEAMP